MATMSANPADRILVQQIRSGDAQAWQRFIQQYEGRLLAFVESRVNDHATAEDVVQETLIGFLTSLPNYDESRPVETYLFAICGFKLTDHLRCQGRRPVLSFNRPASTGEDQAGPLELPGPYRQASSLARSMEQRQLEEQAIQTAIDEQIQRWRERGDWTKLLCLELIFVCGKNNKDVARLLGIAAQQVANYKSDFVRRLRQQIIVQKLNPDVLPELDA